MPHNSLANANHSYYHVGMNNALNAKPAPQANPLAANGVARSQDLLGAGSVLMIEHAGERYVLRLTKNGKLILTK